MLLPKRFRDGAARGSPVGAGRRAADASDAGGLSAFEDETGEAEPEAAIEVPLPSDDPGDAREIRQRGEERLASSLRNWRGGDASGEVLPLAAELCRGSHRGTVTEHLV